MRKKIIIWSIVIIVVFLLYKKCSTNYQSRERHKWTHKVCNNLYAETFCVFGQGGYGTDLDSRWLTDSINFRIYLGTFDEGDGGIYVECGGDTVYVSQLIQPNADSPKKDSARIYKISDLRKKQNLNDY